jgi:hypothetical protein
MKKLLHVETNSEKYMHSLSKFGKSPFLRNENYKLKKREKNSYDTHFMRWEGDCKIFCHKNKIGRVSKF